MSHCGVISFAYFSGTSSFVFSPCPLTLDQHIDSKSPWKTARCYLYFPSILYPVIWSYSVSSVPCIQWFVCIKQFECYVHMFFVLLPCCSSQCYRCYMAVTRSRDWWSGAGRVLGPMVWSLPDTPSCNWWACKTVHRKTELLQAEHWWEPLNCKPIRGPKHPNDLDLQQGGEEGCSDRSGS